MRRIRREVLMLAGSGLLLASALLVLLGRGAPGSGDSPPRFVDFVGPAPVREDAAAATDVARRDFPIGSVDRGLSGRPEAAAEEVAVADRGLDPTSFHASFVDEDGNVIANAQAFVIERPSHVIATAEDLVADLEARSPIPVVTDDKGRIAVRHRPGTIIEIEIRAEGFATKRYRLVDPGRRRRYVVGRPATLQGYVFDELSSAPVAGARLELFDESGERRVIESDPNGAYRFDAVAPGAATLRVFSPDHLRCIKWLRLESATRESKDIVLRPGGRLEVALRDGIGRTVPGVEVRLIEIGTSPQLTVARARTDFDGNVRFGALRSGRRYLVAVDDAELGTARVIAPVIESDTDPTVHATVTLAGNWTLKGRITVDGSPQLGGVAGATVILEATTPDGLTHRTEAVLTDANGDYVVSGLIEGLDYTVLVYHPDFGLVLGGGEAAEEALSPDEPADYGLAPKQEVRGQVVDSNGEPVPFATVYVAVTGETGPVSGIGSELVVQTDGEGLYSFEQFPAGTQLQLQAKDNVHGTYSLGEEVTLTDSAGNPLLLVHKTTESN